MSLSDLVAESASLAPGDSIRIVCPFCGGGGDRERCMSLRSDENTGLLLYHCFRGKCGASGVLGGGVVRTTQDAPRKKVKPPFDASKIVPLGLSLPPHVRVAVYDKLREWGFDESDYGWQFDQASFRLAIPVLGPLGQLRGYVLRAIYNTQSPKVLTGRILTDEVFISWHGIHHKGTVVCVEDIPSAIRVAKCGVRACAILGNQPSDDALNEIAARAQGELVVFAFDADAHQESYSAMRRFSLRGPSGLLHIPKDLKNMTDEEAKNCLKSVH